jgi:hypothetical protein
MNKLAENSNIYLTLETTKLKPPTKREIEDHMERTFKKLQESIKVKEVVVEEIDTEKPFVNENYIKMEQTTKFTEKGIDVIDVTGLDSALNELNVSENDKHPEKRMKAAWNAFMEKKLPEYKAEYPNFKRAQLIDMIQKEVYLSYVV